MSTKNVTEMLKVKSICKVMGEKIHNGDKWPEQLTMTECWGLISVMRLFIQSQLDKWTMKYWHIMNKVSFHEVAGNQWEPQCQVFFPYNYSIFSNHAINNSLPFHEIRTTVQREANIPLFAYLCNSYNSTVIKCGA